MKQSYRISLSQEIMNSERWLFMLQPFLYVLMCKFFLYFTSLISSFHLRVHLFIHQLMAG